MRLLLRRLLMSLPVAALVAGCQTGPILPALPEFITEANTQVVTLNSTGITRIGSGGSDGAISGDGSVVAFQSYNVDIISEELFVHDLATGDITLVSVSSDGTAANRGGQQAALSQDGRFVAFSSRATNLVSGDTNDRADVFVHDRTTGRTQRVSVSDSGAQANADCESPDISSDGRLVVFRSSASNLVAGDTNAAVDVFIHDRVSGTTQRVSLRSDGTQDDGAAGPFFGLTAVISGNGRQVAFASNARSLVADDTNDKVDVFVHDIATGLTTRVSVSSTGMQGDAVSESPSISDDGRFVAFLSSAGTLVAGTPSIASRLFVHDRDADANGVFDEPCDSCRQTRRIELEADPLLRGNGFTGSVTLSGDGRTLAFHRTFSGPIDAPQPNFNFNDPDVYVHDLGTGVTRRVLADLPGLRVVQGMVEFQTVYSGRTDNTSHPRLSDDGSRILYTGALAFTYGETDDQVMVEFRE